MSQKKPKPQQQLVEVTLAKPHIHKDRQYAAGDKVKVTAPERDWLVANQVIAGPAAATEKK